MGVSLDPVDSAGERNNTAMGNPFNHLRITHPGTARNPFQHLGIELMEAFMPAALHLAVANVEPEHAEDLCHSPRALDVANACVVLSLQYVGWGVTEVA